jgi:signal transduction histidine kinase/ActR/RegA family two-component response regulator
MAREKLGWVMGSDPRRLLWILAISVLVGVVALASVVWTGFGSLTAFWPTNAIILVALVRGPRERSWMIGIGLGAFIAMSVPILLVGGSPASAILLAGVNLVEAAAAVWLLRVFGLLDRDLTRPAALLGFVICAAVVAPAVGAAMGAPVVVGLGLSDYAVAWWDFWSADALGMMLVAPFGLVLTRAHLTRLARPIDWAQAAGLLLVIAAACFPLAAQDALHVALLAPLVIFAALRFGAPGATGSVLCAAVAAVGYNLMGWGTIDAGAAGLRHELFELQLALVALPLAALPVAAVLAERDRAAREALAADRARSEFLANMSHEIRTPLNGVVGLAGLLADGAASPRDREMAGIVRGSALTLERLLSDVLDMARVESGGLALETVRFHLGENVRAVAAAITPQVAAKGLRLDLVVEPAADDWRMGDAVRLRQILAALLSNAAKFTEAGHVRLSLSASGEGRVRLTVEDTGVGFDPALKAQIFGRFRQIDGSLTRRFDGAGLGLSLARCLAERMGGALDGDGRPGEGATFVLDLPLPAAQPEAAPSPPGSQGQAEAGTGPLRILLADDNETNRKVVELILAQADVDLVQVENGAEAVAACETAAFDLILMDMQMPVMDGLTAVRRIRQIEAAGGSGRVPILMLTANALPEHVQASLVAGADRHLTKPITAGGLFAAIEDALGGEAQAGAAA